MIRRVALVVALATAVVACDDSGTVTEPPTTAAELGGGLWYLNTANGEALPAKIAERPVGVALEETFLDSAQIVIDVNTGTWRQRYWYRVLLFGTLDRAEVVVDSGSYTIATSSTYFFASGYRTRTLAVSPAGATRMDTTEPIVFFPSAPAVTGLYRRTRP
jgi:hypothetical protein